MKHHFRTFIGAVLVVSLFARQAQFAGAVESNFPLDPSPSPSVSASPDPSASPSVSPSPAIPTTITFYNRIFSTITPIGGLITAQLLGCLQLKRSGQEDKVPKCIELVEERLAQFDYTEHADAIIIKKLAGDVIDALESGTVAEAKKAIDAFADQAAKSSSIPAKFPVDPTLYAIELANLSLAAEGRQIGINTRKALAKYYKNINPETAAALAAQEKKRIAFLKKKLTLLQPLFAELRASGDPKKTRIAELMEKRFKSAIRFIGYASDARTRAANEKDPKKRAAILSELNKRWNTFYQAAVKDARELNKLKKEVNIACIQTPESACQLAPSPSPSPSASPSASPSPSPSPEPSAAVVSPNSLLSSPGIDPPPGSNTPLSSTIAK